MDILSKIWHNRYTIYSNGRVWDAKLNKYLEPYITKDGYLKLTFRLEDSTRKTYYVHRLVALSFIPNIENKETVNHIDADKTNNNLYNLEWATRSEQAQHAWDNDLIKDTQTRKEAVRAKQGKPIIDLTTKDTWDSIGRAAEELGLQKSNISAVCLKKKGFKSAGKTPEGVPRVWRFLSEIEEQE